VRRLCLTGLLVVVLVARSLRCQTAAHGVCDGSIDIGGALLRQPGLATTHVVTLGGQARFAAPTYALSASGVAARTPEDRYTGQGVISASRYAPPSRRLRWELAATASAFGVSDAAPALGWQVLAREHLGWSLGGVFVGAAGGAVVQDGISRPVVTAHTGGFFRFDALGRDELSGALAFTHAGTAPDSVGRPRYADAIGYWTHRAGPVELVAGGGLRMNGSHRSGVLSWGTASAVFWIIPDAAVVVATGRALEDVTRGVPSVRYLSLSFRVGSGSRRAPAAARAKRSSLDDDGGRLEVRAGLDSVRVVTVHLHTATAVELMADFTDWEPIRMTQLPNGDWTVEQVIAPGTHRVAIRIDGARWMAPPNLPRVADDFGGEVGLLIVP
jgi:hypothetical protein